jgi:NTE family protein
MKNPKPRIHLVLGSGGARGIVHIGVIRGLEASGFTISSITGCSMGAVVGGMYSAGHLDIYETWLHTLTRGKVWGFLDLTLTKQGFVKGEKVLAQLREFAGEQSIENLRIPFSAVATDLLQRQEVVYRSGDLYKALRASIGIPGVFTPVAEEGSFLIDGGVLNPLPLNHVLRQPGELVVAVHLNGHPAALASAAKRETIDPAKGTPAESWLSRFLPTTNTTKKSSSQDINYSIVDLLSTSYDFTAYRMVELMQQLHPADIFIDIPRNICGSFDFHKAAALIDAGKEAWENAYERYKGYQSITSS